MPPPWTDVDLGAERQKAIEVFRQRRTNEPIEAYLDAFDHYQSVLEELLETTIDLSADAATMTSIVSEPELLEAFRYLAGPPVSEDDLEVLADAVLTPSRLKPKERQGDGEESSRSRPPWPRPSALSVGCRGAGAK